MRGRIDFLASGRYGYELDAWSDLLIPIFDRFVATFERPEDKDLKTFWLNVAHATSMELSGQTDTFSDWITAFAYFRTDGEINQLCRYPRSCRSWMGLCIRLSSRPVCRAVSLKFRWLFRR
jgi:hypothetical protein